MDIKEIGEFGFIEQIADRFKSLVPKSIYGIGDDCAIIPANETEDFVVSTDLLIEGVHFLRDKITPFNLGYKSLAVNLSDIAAMGAEPVGAFLSIGIPKDCSSELLDGFTEGFMALSQKHDTPLLGGDTTKSLRDLMINVTVIGKCPKEKALLRSSAKARDVIAVTGNLGDSAAGLNVILNNAELNSDTKHLIEKHNKPEPQINEGLWLAKQNGVHAMMDISDGIASDLNHILKASEKSAVVDLQKVPVSEILSRTAKKYDWNAAELAVSGGEDYELLLTISAECATDIAQQFYAEFGKPLHIIGEVKAPVEKAIQWVSGEEKLPDFKGFNHY